MGYHRGHGANKLGTPEERNLREDIVIIRGDLLRVRTYVKLQHQDILKMLEDIERQVSSPSVKESLQLVCSRVKGLDLILSKERHED